MKDFLKEKRVSAGLSQREVADKMGYSTPQFVSNWERGISHPPIAQLKKLAELYGIRAEDLFETFLEREIESIKKDLRRKFSASSKRCTYSA